MSVNSLAIKDLFWKLEGVHVCERMFFGFPARVQVSAVEEDRDVRVHVDELVGDKGFLSGS